MLTPGVRVQVPPRAPNEKRLPMVVVFCFMCEALEEKPIRWAPTKPYGFVGKRKNLCDRDGGHARVFVSSPHKGSFAVPPRALLTAAPLPPLPKGHPLWVCNAWGTASAVEGFSSRSFFDMRYTRLRAFGTSLGMTTVDSFEQ